MDAERLIMKPSRVVMTQKSEWSVNSDLLVYCLEEEKNKVPVSPLFLKKPVKQAYDLGDFKAKKKERLLLYPSVFSKKKEIKAKRILVMGMGKIDKKAGKNETGETLRLLGAEMAKACA